MTNIRPSHYFISIPRTSVAYKRTEQPQSDSIHTKRDFGSVSGNRLKVAKEFCAYDTKVKGWYKKDMPSLPSERMSEAKDMTKTLRHYQKLRRVLADEARKTTYSNNRWREGAGQVINTMKSNPPCDMGGIRTKASLKYQRKHKDIMEHETCKFTSLIF